MPEKPPSENYHEVIAELRERIAYLESELGLSNKAELTQSYEAAFGITAQMSRTLIALMQAKGKTLTRAQLEDAMERRSNGDHPDIVGIYICRLRKALGFDVIENVWGHGYRLSPSGRTMIEARLSLSNERVSFSLVKA